MKKTSVINLQDYRPVGVHSRVIAGAARGVEVREASRIDELEAESEEVIIHVPEDMGAVNPSFLEQFLLHVVLKLRENFFNKFKFENNGYYKIKPDVDEAVDRILRADQVKRMLREDREEEEKRRLRREEKALR